MTLFLEMRPSTLVCEFHYKKENEQYEYPINEFVRIDCECVRLRWFTDESGYQNGQING